MFRKMVAMLVVLTLFGFSTAHAYDADDGDGAAGAVLVAGLAVVTAAFLLASHDRHEEYRPAPRHVPERPRDFRGHEEYRDRDGRWNDDCQPRDERHDNGYHRGWYR